MRYEYTDNLFLTPSDKNRETIATYGPTLSLVQDGRLLQLDLDYAYERYEFLDEPELNDANDKHFGTLDGVVFPENNFNVELQADARLESLDRRRSDVTELPSVNTLNRYYGQARPVYKFRWGAQYTGEIAYVYETVRYEQDIGDETESNKGELSLGKEWSTRTKLILAGFFEQFETRRNMDYDRIQATLGVEWGSAEAVEFSLTGGMAWFDYDDGRDSDSLVVDGRFHYAVGRLHAIDIEYVEAVEHDVTDGQFETRRTEGSISRTARFGWQIGYFYRDDHFVEVERDDRDYGPMVALSYQLTPRLAFRINGESRKLKFDPLAEKVDRDNIRAVVEYQPRDTVRLSCSYDYRKNDSSIDVNDYVENRAFCEAQLSFYLVRR